MPNPQIEEGFIQIACGKPDNDILSALISANLTSTEYQVCLYVIRKTWGFKKKQDWISYTQFMKATHKSRISIWSTLNRLVKQGLLVKHTELGKMTMYQLNKDFSTWRLVRQGKLVNNTKLVKKAEHTSKASLTRLVKQTEPTKETITKDNNTKEIIPKGIKQSYGNPDINFILETLKEKLGLPALDQSIKSNRQYAFLLLKASKKGVNGVEWLIDQAASDDWWRNHITSSKDLYYNRVKIIANRRQNANKFIGTI